MTIRPALETDIPAMAHIQTALNPNYPYTAEAFAREMQQAREHPLGLHEAYWVAESGDEVVAYANVSQYAAMHHPDRYFAYVQVLPQGRGQGLGKALAEVLSEYLQARAAREVIGGAYDNEPAAPPLMARYGLSECQRYFDSHLDVTAFDLAAWQKQEQLPAGLRMLSFSQLRQEYGEEAAWRIYFELYCATILDVPAPSARTLPTFADFQNHFNDPNFNPDALLLALDANGQGVAYSVLWRTENEPDHWKIGITSVRREWRRHGLALALKLGGIRLAQAAGIRTITTNAESGNLPMLRLNERLGFKNDVAFVEYKWGGIEENQP